MQKLKITFLLFSIIFITGCKSNMKNENNISLPEYITLNLETLNNSEAKTIRIKAKTLNFPLSAEDLRDVSILEKKYDQEENCAGLAAPQIGISKCIIIFAVHENEELKKWRPDLTDTMPKTIWINPSYKAIGAEKHEDYEGCFSVENATGPVARFKKIHYQAYDINGNQIQGIAEGFLARVIQHEIDHLNGKVFLDYVAPEKRMSKEEYLDMRKKTMQQQATNIKS
ncbi:Peptide deformylase [Rickettsia tillamookensis]|uniref:Peptide deformylase n=1 Tax=Rickettsia tillamookensis TaxID=2761623 RepID=A0A9E6SPY6_9RICK|nr:peptide deformylase [Rickettsia tillamookensis]QQV74545.1 Peptide deformylase [Rickettsia tillamookensis]